MLDDVERSLISVKHRLQHLRTFLLFSGVNSSVALVWSSCSTLLNARMPTKLTLWVSVSMAIIYCLYWLPDRALSRECPSYSVENEQSFESLDEESLNTSDRSSNRKRKGKGVSETVRPGIARR